MFSKRDPVLPRFVPSNHEMAAIIRGLYLSLLGREADAPGLAYWLHTWQHGCDLDSIAASLMASEEFRTSISSTRRLAAAEGCTQQAAQVAAQVLADSPIVIVDIGAQNLDNEEHVNAALGRLGVPQRIVGFEPLEHRLQERQLSAGSELSLLARFIGDGQVHNFHVNEPDATSSLLPFNRAVTDRLLELAPLRTVRTEPVSTTTLDAALACEPAVDMLKLDIQGFELTALRHATSVLQRTLVVHCEVSFAEIYQGGALFSEVEQHLRGSGFDLVDLSTLCRYPLTGTSFPESRDLLGWGDAVFFRRLSDCAPWRELLVQSLIALAVYRKPSLAAGLARGLEDTQGAAYLAALTQRGITSP